MIKVRLWGELEDVNKLAELISGLTPRLRVLSCSKNYADRGASVYTRVYMDVELCEVKNRSERSEPPCSVKSARVEYQSGANPVDIKKFI